MKPLNEMIKEELYTEAVRLTEAIKASERLCEHYADLIASLRRSRENWQTTAIVSLMTLFGAIAHYYF